MVEGPAVGEGSGVRGLCKVRRGNTTKGIIRQVKELLLYPMECREPQAVVFQGERHSGGSLGMQVGGWLGMGSHRGQGNQLGDNGWWFRLDGELPKGGETRLDERKNVGFERGRGWR